MKRLFVIALTAALLSGQATACELDGLFGLTTGETVPRELIEERFDENWMGILHFRFKPRMEQPPFLPLEAHATGRQLLLTSVTGVFRAESVDAAKEFLQEQIDTLTDSNLSSIPVIAFS